MFALSTKSKIFIGSILSKILIFFLGDKKKIILRNNIKYEVDLNEAVDLGIFLGIKNERNLYKIKNFLNPNSKHILVDIGSNVGSVTLPLAKFFHSSTIISIEPTNFAFSKLKKNLKLNPNLEKRVRLVNVFISNEKKKVNFVHSSWYLKSKHNRHKVHLGTLKKTSNKTKTLSQLLDKFEKKVDFIKIDVDGYEINVLKSGKKIINKYRPLIYFEYAPYLYKEFGYSPKILIDFIKKELNYIFLNENFNEVKNIYEIGKKLNVRSENFFLIHKKNLPKFKNLQS